MRRTAREIVYKTIYSNLFNPDGESVFEDLIKENDLTQNDIDFCKKLYSTVNEHIDEFNQSISDIAKNYKLERIFPTDKCAMYIGMCEMKYFDDIPNIVAIDEALALCRIYSTKESLNFVNGIFAEYKNILENN
ncbi:MAG: transcription antitermination factor NusB [Christensenellaceae bacterium]